VGNVLKMVCASHRPFELLALVVVSLPDRWMDSSHLKEMKFGVGPSIVQHRPNRPSMPSAKVKALAANPWARLNTCRLTSSFDQGDAGPLPSFSKPRFT
jgi:hypothetical protein